MNSRALFIFFIASLFACINSVSSQYTMPFEELPHEGTWLQWPHNYTYGFGAEDFEPAWIQMTAALVVDERVHIIAYNEDLKIHIINLLEGAEVDMSQVDFVIAENDDFWVRDNGPIFVYDSDVNLTILDWGFNGWGGGAPFELCDDIPIVVADSLNIPIIDLNEMVLEGGAIEIDGYGTLMATRTSITGPDRNPNLTEAQIEDYLQQYLGVSNFVWLDGQFGGLDDITDQHIDGFARFHGNNTIVTMNHTDQAYWGVSFSDRTIINNAINNVGVPFELVHLPLTANDVVTTWGESVGYRSSYTNYYIANGVILVPNYNDPNDSLANSIIASLYPNKDIVGIDCRNMLSVGGMVHCVTQQQPIGAINTSLSEFILDENSKDLGKLICVYDLLGRIDECPQPGNIYVFQYENGDVKKMLAY